MAESTIERILSRLEESDNDGVAEKTASETEPTVDTSTALLNTVRQISSEVKTASAPAEDSPAKNLETMAKEAHEAENGRIVKEAQFMGAAIADGFMQRFAAYDDALSNTKVASDSPDLEKVAAAAYQKAVQDMEKHAADEYEKGYRDQLVAVHKIASDIHYAGQAVAHQIVNSNG
jgi:hypothetical protein